MIDEPKGEPVIDIATLDTMGRRHWLRLRHRYSPLMKAIREKHRKLNEALGKMNRVNRTKP